MKNGIEKASNYLTQGSEDWHFLKIKMQDAKESTKKKLEQVFANVLRVLYNLRLNKFPKVNWFHRSLTFDY